MTHSKTDTETSAPAGLCDGALDRLSAGALRGGPDPRRAIEVIEYQEGGENSMVRGGGRLPEGGI